MMWWSWLLLGIAGGILVTVFAWAWIWTKGFKDWGMGL